MLIVGKRRALDERLQRRLAVAVLARVRVLGVVPCIQASMSVCNSSSVRALGPRSRVLDVLQVEVQRELVALAVAAVLAAAVGEDPQQRHAMLLEERQHLYR